MRRQSVRKFTPAKGKRVKAAPSYGKAALGIAVTALILVVVLVNLFTFVFSIVNYYGNGMEPTLQDRQTLVIRKTEQVEEGDMIAFYYNNKALVRRVICAGGKMITIDDAGRVTIDGEPLEEPYVEDPSLGQCNLTFPYNVPAGQYFVMGDNREIAMDSRLSEIGTISSDRILGKVIFVI